MNTLFEKIHKYCDYILSCCCNSYFLSFVSDINDEQLMRSKTNTDWCFLSEEKFVEEVSKNLPAKYLKQQII